MTQRGTTNTVCQRDWSFDNEREVDLRVMVTAEACRSYSFLVSVCLCSEPASDAAMQDQLGRWPITPRDNGVGDHTQQQRLNSDPSR